MLTPRSVLGASIVRRMAWPYLIEGGVKMGQFKENLGCIMLAASKNTSLRGYCSQG